MCLETEDLKAAVAKAVAAGAMSESEIEEFEGACCYAERVRSLNLSFLKLDKKIINKSLHVPHDFPLNFT